jgi:two-component system CheB/CheR fusion protein
VRPLLWNRRYQELLEGQKIGHLLKPGTAFETLIDAQIGQGLIIESAGRESQWRQWRLELLSQPAQAFDVQVTPDKWFHVRQQRLPDGSLLMAQFDIGERKQAEKLLLQAKREAERANTMKSRFLAIASHDLRQPLQGMRILKDLLAMRATDSETVEILEDWERTLTIMERLVSGYLDISRLESGAVVAEPGAFPVRPLLEQIADEFALPARRKQLQLRLVSSSAVIYSDRLLLGQIVRNFVANAVDYTQTGKILIGCRRRTDRLSLQVWDSGPGIAENQQNKIFEEFYQIGNQARSGGRSYGLGLAIAKLSSQLLQHSIEVFSRPGKGSLFAVEVPYGQFDMPATVPAEAEYRSVTDAAAADGMILIVEDEATIRHALELLLRSRGFQLVICDSGEQALQQLSRQQLQPQLVITDLRLPGAYTGLDWLKKLRQVLPSAIPVLVITGDTSPGLHNPIEAIGCMLLTKPVHAGKLLNIIELQLHLLNPV